MDFKLFFLTLSLFWSASEAVKCFKCNMGVKTSDPSSISPTSCAGGQMEKRGGTDCPNGCTKFTTVFPDGDRKYDRGCAEPWKTRDECGEMHVGGAVYTKCFCNEDYCNDAAKFSASTMAGLLLILIVLAL